MNMKLINLDIPVENLNIMTRYINEQETNSKYVNDVLSNLDMYNITVRFTDITMIQYTLLLTIKDVNPRLIKQKDIKFGKLINEDDKINNEYNRLISKYIDLRKKLDLFSDTILEALEPGSRLVDVEICLSIKDLIRFINVCSKYDELIDLIVVLTNNEITEKIVSLSFKINNTNNYDLYMRNEISKDIREELIVENNKLFILSDIEYVNKSIEEGNAHSKISILTYGNYLEIRDLTNKLLNVNLKLENPKLVDKGNYSIDIILPEEFYMISDEDLINELDGYIYDWISLIKNIQKEEYYYNDILSCHLGCFANIFTMNNTINDYFRLQYTGIGHEVVGLLTNLKQNIK